MSEKIKEAKSFLGFSIGPVVNLIIGLISVPITTRLLLPTQFGIATFYSTNEALSHLTKAGFGDFKIKQTILSENEKELIKNGYGEGSFVVIRGEKKI